MIKTVGIVRFKKFLPSITIKEGKKRMLCVPCSPKKKVTVHIMHIFTFIDKKGNEDPFIVYRVWIKKKKAWDFRAIKLVTLQLLNNHIYNIKLGNDETYKKGQKKPTTTPSTKKNKTSGKSIQKDKDKTNKSK